MAKCVVLSIGIDFHKTGYCPYPSSLLLVPDGQKLQEIGRDKRDIPYLFHDGEYHPGIYSLECSRSATGIVSAYASLQCLGKNGFRTLLGHGVECNLYLRSELNALDNVAICNLSNDGPATIFRIYPQSRNAQDEFEKEMAGKLNRQHVLAGRAQVGAELVHVR